MNNSKELPTAVDLRIQPLASGMTSHKRAPVVCVGLPVYNGGETLNQAIESILSQDFQNIELIISDNCSEDNTKDICLYYQKIDKRVRYYKLEENLGASKNFSNVLGLSNAPYFMWASDDDLREPTFISKCLEKIEQDPSIVLVYPRTRVLDRNSKQLHIAKDNINADKDNPIERFLNLICELRMCHMFYGLFRTHMIKKVRSWNSGGLFLDNLILAELSLLGKIVQINDVLFVRRLTRNYNYNSFDERISQLISEIDTHMFNEGITLPYCRHTYTHLELINHSEIQEQAKIFLTNAIIKFFRLKFGTYMEYEISRAIELINNEQFYCTWDKKQRFVNNSGPLTMVDYFNISNLLKHLQEALFIFPERSDLKEAYKLCLEKVSISK